MLDRGTVLAAVAALLTVVLLLPDWQGAHVEITTFSGDEAPAYAGIRVQEDGASGLDVLPPWALMVREGGDEMRKLNSFFFPGSIFAALVNWWRPTSSRVAAS